jgi:hypothetical protein
LPAPDGLQPAQRFAHVEKSFEFWDNPTDAIYDTLRSFFAL